ncbi:MULTISPECIES: hypothetical protein [unclassified Pseudonocardia]|jgi:hypothetical protein|uniref:hypothetical protein n=1 Tax=unclassified Pseudonocardia TaxID=2619320 RepID=UPI000966D391|nr:MULTISPECIES: hypothetical protein [unclassified Pseudonocardia]MBN9102576.1 hypothetical protein [Pseudonocardia sp.]OJY46846.1 MAG: hypothetical protein BGP03_27365 [Pseudonocardia sp. 73-21]
MISPIEVAQAALENFHDVTADDDGSLTFAHGGVLCVVQGIELEEGLPVLNLTCVVAWDLPLETDVPTRVAMGAGEGLFGTPRVIRGEKGWDVTLRYAFPAAGLDEKAMGTLLMLVVGNASTLRAELTGA